MAQISYHELTQKKINQIKKQQLNQEDIRVPINIIERKLKKNIVSNNDWDDEFEIDFDSKDQQGSANPLFDFIFNPSEKNFQEVAIISGQRGCGKSTILKRIEWLIWMDSQLKYPSTIPIMIYLENGIVSELCYQKQIIEYLDLDVAEYKQFVEFVQNAQLSLLFLVDTNTEMTFDQFFQNLSMIKTFNNNVQQCKIIFCLDYYNLQLIQEYSQDDLHLINFEVQLFSEKQIQQYHKLYYGKIVKQKVEDFIKKRFQQQSLQQYQDQIFTISQNVIEMKVINSDENFHKEIIIQQLKQIQQCKDLPIETNEFELIFEQVISQVNQLQDYKQLKQLFDHFQIEILLSTPKILKPLIQILIEEKLSENMSYFQFFETILFNFLKIENMESTQFDLALDSVKIFNFIINFMEIKSSESIFLKTYEILRCLIEKPFQNTQYLSLIIRNQGIIDYLTASFIYNKILSVQDEMQDVCKQNQISIIDQEELYFNEFDISQLEYCKKLQKEGLFKSVDLSTQNYKGVVKMLKEKCWKNQVIIQKLLNIIKASSLIDNFQQEAGNAFTILCELKGIIRNENFSYIRLKNSILNGTSFYECNFSCSEMDNVSIICCQFVGCSLDSARWSDMKNLIIQKFIRVQYHSVHSHNQQNECIVASSENEQFFAQIIDKKKVMLYDFTTQLQQDFLQGILNISSLSISPNSMYLIACSRSELNLLQLKTKKFSRMKINVDDLCQIRFLNNEEIALHSYKNCIRIYNIKNQKLLRQYKTEQSVSFTISSDSKIMVVAEDRQLNVMSLKTFKFKFTLRGYDPMQFSQNSQLLAFTNKYDSISIYNIGIKFELMVLELDEQKPQSISFSPDNQLIATSYCDNRKIYFWSLHTGEQLYMFELDRVSWISFYNKKFAFGDSYSTYLLDFEAVKYASELQNSKGEFSSFSLFGDYLAAGCKDHSIFLWDLEIGKIVDKLKAHEDEVLTVQYSYDGLLLASGSLDNSVCIWEMEARNLRFRLQGHTKEINSVFFTSNGKLLASGSSDQTVRFWNVQTGSLIKTLNYPTEITSISIISNDKIFMAGGQNGSIFSTDLGTENTKEIVIFDEPIQSILYSHDQSVILFTSKSQIILWDVQNNTQLDQQMTQTQSIAMQEKLVISNYQNRTMIWQIIQNNLQLIDTIQISYKRNNLIAFHPNKNALITACKEHQNIELSDLKVNLRNELEFQETNNQIKQSNYEPQYIQGNIFLNQDSDPELIDLKPVAFSYNQDILASGYDDGAVILWSVKTGQLLLKLVEHKSKISCLHFSPTQSILISGSADKTVIVWDTQRGQMIGKLQGHKNTITELVFSPNGLLIASGSKDGNIILWQVEKLSQLQEFNIQSKVICIDFSPNSKKLVSLGDDQVIYFWNVEKNQIIYKSKEYRCYWIAFWTNNKVLLSCSQGTFAYNMKTRQRINHTFWSSAISKQVKFCQKNQILVLLQDEYIYAYDLKISKKIDEQRKFSFPKLALSADGKMLSKLEYNTINIIAFESDKYLEYSLYEPGLNYGSNGFSGFVKFYATKDTFNNLTLKDTKQQEILFQIKDYEGFPISVDKYQNILVLANWDKTILFWDTEANIQINILEHLQSQVNQIKFSPNGKLIACTTFDLKLLLIEMDTLLLKQSLELPKISTSPLFFSDDSKKIFFQIDDCICIWRDEQCEQLQIIGASSYAISSFHLSKDDKYLTCEYPHNQIYSFCLKDSKFCCKRSKESRVYSVLPYDNEFNVNLLSIADAKICNRYGVDLPERMCMI